MRVLGLVVAVSVATMWTVGCGPKKEDLPQLEPADVRAAPPAAEKGPATFEPAPVAPIPVARPKPGPGTVEVAPPVGPQTYTVKKGDTLYSLSRRFYGDGKLWTRIADANKDKIKDVKDLPVGAVLAIPPK